MSQRLTSLVLLICLGVLSACAPADPPPTATPVPAATPTATPAPASTPAAAPLSAEPPQGACLAQGSFPPLLAGLRYGINAFLFGTDTGRALALAQTGGYGWLRQQVHWRDIETQPGRYDWRMLDQLAGAAQQRGLRLMLSVVRSPRWATASGGGGLPDDPASIAPFLRALAERYRQRVGAYEIWNEPNLAIENGGRAATPAQYLALLQAARSAIKQGDGCALVLAAPLAATATDDPSVAVDDLRFYRELYGLADGAFLRAADLLALHPGGGAHAFDATWPADAPQQSRFYFRHIAEIRQIMQQAGDLRQAWITEVGWTSYQAAGAPPPVGAAQQGENLVGALKLVRSDYPWVSGVFVWNLNFAVLGAATDEKSAFSILRADWAPQPAYLALQHYLAARALEEQRAAPQLGDGAPYGAGWQVSVEGKIHAPAALDSQGNVYIGSDVGKLYAVAPGGGVRWVFAARGSTREAPAIDRQDTLYLGDGGGYITALKPDGTQLWQRDLGGAPSGSPLLDGDRLYVATRAGQAIQLDLSGRLLWQTSLGGAAAPALLARPSGEPAPLLYVPTQAGDLLAIDMSGAIRWRAHIGTRIICRPALAERPQGPAQLLVGDGDGYLVSLEPGSGRQRWRHKLVERIESPTLPATSALIAAAPRSGPDGTIYLAGRDGTLTALDAGGGVRWRYSSGSDISVPPLLAPDGTIVLGLFNKHLLALGADGAPRWQIKLNGAVRSTPLRGPDGTLYVGTIGGRLYALPPRAPGTSAAAQ